MESNGKANCIHVSEATAELLRGHGRGLWLRKREDLVDAKGKGMMQTYYVVTGTGTFSVADTDISSFSGGSNKFDSLSSHSKKVPPLALYMKDEESDSWGGDEGLSLESTTDEVSHEKDSAGSR
jgi:hypothetical protein